MSRFEMFAIALSSGVLVACSSGGPTLGAEDTHCDDVTTVTEADCHLMPSADAGTMPEHEHEVIRFNGEADDDDCKYHVVLLSTGAAQQSDTTLTLSVTTKATGKPTVGAAPELEVYLSDSHPAPEVATKVTEPSPGTYVLAPVRFDTAGRWTVKVHLFDECTDVSEHSPHSHVSFAFDVP